MLAVGLFIRNKVSESGGNPGFAAAKMLAAMNPDVEVVSADEGTGKITLREKKTGKTVTLDFQDIEKGRISFEDESGEKLDIQTEGEGGRGSVTMKGSDGTMQWGTGSLADVPGWVPKFPGARMEGAFSAQGKGGGERQLPAQMRRFGPEGGGLLRAGAQGRRYGGRETRHAGRREVHGHADGFRDNRPQCHCQCHLG